MVLQRTLTRLATGASSSEAADLYIFRTLRCTGQTANNMFDKNNGGVLPKTDQGNDLFVLTTTDGLGQYEGKLFKNKGLAVIELNRIIDAHKRGHIHPNTSDTEKEYRVQTLNDALSVDGKKIWVVRHKLLHAVSTGENDWENYYSSRDEARKQFEHVVDIYGHQAMIMRDVNIARDSQELTVYIGGEPVIKVDYDIREIGLDEKSNCLCLSSI